MSDTVLNLRRIISGVNDLQSVVRTMKAVAASSIGQYERAVSALTDYYHTVELGLGECLREAMPAHSAAKGQKKQASAMVVVVFGSDQGLVGQFNDVVADFALATLGSLKAKPEVWAVGERVHGRLVDEGLPLKGLYAVPNSVKGITPLIGQILNECMVSGRQDEVTELYLIYNSPTRGTAYAPISQRVLPLDESWLRRLKELPWPTSTVPQMIGGGTDMLKVLIREYLFVSIFRVCAASLAAENACRLAAMQRADKNISELLETLISAFHRIRQSGIDEELFDVIAGFEALGTDNKPVRDVAHAIMQDVN
ncbi:MAG: F0F1 ATP synthase subunit gamma [Armatimonadota bacterium]